MPARKKPKNYGQTFFPEVQRSVEESYQGRPKGMPCLEVMQSEALRIGQTKDDAAYLYDRWMANGFTQGGHKLKSWKHALRYWQRNGWLPSQKGIKPGSKDESYPTYERVAAWCEKKKMRPLTKRAWGELFTGKFRGKLITNQTDFEAALEVILAQWLREP